MRQPRTITEAELRAKLDGLALSDEQTLNQVICSLVGHSRITTHCFGYHYCARCGAQIGDSLRSIYSARGDVIAGHACDTCRDNFAQCDWADKLNVRDPMVDYDDVDTAPYLLRYEPITVEATQ